MLRSMSCVCCARGIDATTPARSAMDSRATASFISSSTGRGSAAMSTVSASASALSKRSAKRARASARSSGENETLSFAAAASNSSSKAVRMASRPDMRAHLVTIRELAKPCQAPDRLDLRTGWRQAGRHDASPARAARGRGHALPGGCRVRGWSSAIRGGRSGGVRREPFRGRRGAPRGGRQAARDALEAARAAEPRQGLHVPLSATAGSSGRLHGGRATCYQARVDGTRGMGDSIGRPLPERDATRVDGGALIGRILGEQDVRYCFTVNGGHIWPILSHLREHDVKMIHMRHEQSCAYAADAWARTTGKPGVLAVTAGCGLTNAVTGLCVAGLAGSPVVCLAGQHPTTEDYLGSFQEAYGSEICRTFSKHTKRVLDW